MFKPSIPLQTTEGGPFLYLATARLDPERHHFPGLGGKIVEKDRTFPPDFAHGRSRTEIYGLDSIHCDGVSQKSSGGTRR